MNEAEDNLINRIDTSTAMSCLQRFNAGLKAMEDKMVADECRELERKIVHHQNIINDLKARQDRLLKVGIGRKIWELHT